VGPLRDKRSEAGIVEIGADYRVDRDTPGAHAFDRADDRVAHRFVEGVRPRCGSTDVVCSPHCARGDGMACRAPSAANTVSDGHG